MSEAKQSSSFFAQHDGLPRRFAPRNDGGYSFAFSRRDAPEVLQENLAP
jgi:hypothetical protein